MPKADVRASTARVSTAHKKSVRSAKTKAADTYTEKSIENAKHLLSCGPPSQRDLLFFGVDVLKELCEVKGILAISTGRRPGKPLKLDYVRALCQYVS
jgi:hypothetical protein